MKATVLKNNNSKHKELYSNKDVKKKIVKWSRINEEIHDVLVGKTISRKMLIPPKSSINLMPYQ